MSDWPIRCTTAVRLKQSVQPAVFVSPPMPESVLTAGCVFPESRLQHFDILSSTRICPSLSGPDGLFRPSLCMKTIPAIITLTTDFGLTDPYVGQLKGALLKGCRNAVIVDITHAIPPWDIAAAALTLSTSYGFFPEGSVHLAVVDPEVGSRRSILAVVGDGHFFIGPDNGILSFLVGEGKIEAIHRLANPVFFSASVSSTFHGRDLMAPLATYLANGGLFDDIGPEISPRDMIIVTESSVSRQGHRLHGQVRHIDHFGNIRTNIRCRSGQVDLRSVDELEIGGRRITHLARTYSEAEIGALLVLVDSSGYLEIAANRANAAVVLGISIGDAVIAHLAPSAMIHPPV
jgi:S-adenosyl-L-methionine hydrolase (adenosine-forming)